MPGNPSVVVGVQVAVRSPPPQQTSSQPAAVSWPPLLLLQVGAESGGAVSAVRVAPPFSPVAALEVTPAAETSTRLPATSEASRCTSPLETATALPSVSLGPGSIVLASIATESEVARTRVVVW